MSLEKFDNYCQQALAEFEDIDDLLPNTEDEKENGDCYSKDDAKILINNEFESDVCRRDPKIDDWVLVRFATKKSVKYFIGNIISINENNIPNVKFLRKQRTVSLCPFTTLMWRIYRK